MPKPDTDRLLQNLAHQMSDIQQILPTLATKDEMRVAIAPLATKEEMHAAIALLATKEEMHAAIGAATAPLATRDEMHAAIAAAVAPLATREEMRAAIRTEGEETRRHFDVVGESIRSEVRLIAEGHSHLTHRVDTLEHKTARDVADLDRRVLRLEAKRNR